MERALILKRKPGRCYECPLINACWGGDIADTDMGRKCPLHKIPLAREGHTDFDNGWNACRSVLMKGIDRRKLKKGDCVWCADIDDAMLYFKELTALGIVCEITTTVNDKADTGPKKFKVVVMEDEK